MVISNQIDIAARAMEQMRRITHKRRSLLFMDWDWEYRWHAVVPWPNHWFLIQKNLELDYTVEAITLYLDKHQTMFLAGIIIDYYSDGEEAGFIFH